MKTLASYYQNSSRSSRTAINLLGINELHLKQLLCYDINDKTSLDYTLIKKFWTLYEVTKCPASYMIELSPRVFTIASELVQTLTLKRIGGYLNFTYLNGIYTQYKDGLCKIVSTQQELFKSNLFTLIEKRFIVKTIKSILNDDIDEQDYLNKKTFMEFIQSKNLSYELSEYLSSIICPFYGDYTQISAKDGLQKITSILRSSPNSLEKAFLVGHYGGCSEIIQTFCRYLAYLFMLRITVVLCKNCITYVNFQILCSLRWYIHAIKKNR